MKEKAEVLSELKRMLAEVLAAQAAGAANARVARAHGYVDGYMRALIELGFVEKRELVELVNGERERLTPPVRARSDVATTAFATAVA